MHPALHLTAHSTASATFDTWQLGALGAALVVALLGCAAAQLRAGRRAREDADLVRSVAGVLREMSSGLDGRQALCEAAQRITGASSAALYEPGSGAGRPPTAPTAAAGSPGTGLTDRLQYRLALEVWMEERPRFVAEAPGGALLLEPVARDGAAIAVLCLRFESGAVPPSRRRYAAVGLLAVEAAVAIERAELHARVRASDRAEAAARLARDLHDSVSQEVALASTYAQLAMKALDGATADARELIEEAARQLDRAEEDMRHVMHSLREGGTGDGAASLPELIDALAAEHERRGGAPVWVAKDVADWSRVAPECADAMYFVVREALHNALKHARGAPVRVSLHDEGGRLSVVVQDDGPGFDPTATPEGRLGLVGMRERAETLGGWTRVSSSPGGGTKIVVALPRDQQAVTSG